MQDDLPFDLRDPLYVELKSVFIKAFSEGGATQLDYDRLARHEIDGLEVTPVYYEGRIGPGLTFRHEIVIFYDPDEFGVEDYGLPHGDREFERNIAAYVEAVFPRKVFGPLTYAPIEAQGDDHVAMWFSKGSPEVSAVFRKQPAIARALGFAEEVRLLRTISNAEADQYFRSISPTVSDDERPYPPEGLCAGMWIRRDGGTS